MTILIKIGPNIGVFSSKERLAAWAGLCPGHNASDGKRRNARTRIGSQTLRATLVECAHGAARTKGCQFEAHRRALAARRGYKRAIVASAHKLLRIIYVVHKTGRPYYTALPTTKCWWSSATPRGGSVCSAATAILSPWTCNSRPPDRPLPQATRLRGTGDRTTLGKSATRTRKADTDVRHQHRSPGVGRPPLAPSPNLFHGKHRIFTGGREGVDGSFGELPDSLVRHHEFPVSDFLRAVSGSSLVIEPQATEVVILRIEAYRRRGSKTNVDTQLAN